MTGLWIPLLLHLHLVLGVSLPDPFNVSIASFNMEHMLSFTPGPGTPTDTHFRVQVLRTRQKISWKPVARCLVLTAGETCNLTRAFKDLFTQYRARVQAFTPTQTSNWTMSGQFLPLTDTVLGPPKVSVSGCGNCLHLQVSPPTARGQQYEQLKDLYRVIRCLVRRTRDGAQFSVNLPYKDETTTVINYLEPGVEYCVTVTVTTMVNPNSEATKPHCAFTSPPATSSVHVVLTVLCVCCVLGLLLVGLVVYVGHVTSKLQRQGLPRTLSSIPIQSQSPGSAQPEQFNYLPST